MNRTLALLTFCVLLVGCARDRPQEVLGTVERDRLELIAESNERIVRIAVREGDHVVAGAVLVEQEAGPGRAANQPGTRRAGGGAAPPGRPRSGAAPARSRRGPCHPGGSGRFAANGPGGIRARAVAGRAPAVERVEPRPGARPAGCVARGARRRPGTPGPAAGRDAHGADRRGTVRSGAGDRRAGRSRDRRCALHDPCAPRRPGRSAALQARGTPAGRSAGGRAARGRRRRTHACTSRSRCARSSRPGTKVEVRADGVPGPVAGVVRYVSAEAAFTPYYSLTQKDRSRLAYVAEITLDGATAGELPAGLPVQVRVPADGR